MTKERTVVVCERGELLKRLIAVDSESHLQNGLYPRLLELFAGQEKDAIGLVIGLNLALTDYYDDLGVTPGSSEARAHDLVFELMFPRYLEAISSNDEVTAEAKRVHEAVRQKALQG
jgi:hypothetical protein